MIQIRVCSIQFGPSSLQNLALNVLQISLIVSACLSQIMNSYKVSLLANIYVLAFSMCIYLQYMIQTLSCLKSSPVQNDNFVKVNNDQSSSLQYLQSNPQVGSQYIDESLVMNELGIGLGLDDETIRQR